MSDTLTAQSSGNSLATNHPGDAAAFILTGFGVSGIPVAVDIPQTVPIPAKIFATCFAGFNPGFLATSSEPGRRGYFWGRPGSFDVGIFQTDYNQIEVVGLGELLSIEGGLKEAPVYMVTGDVDDVFCLAATCGDGPLSPQAQDCALFPKASACEYFIPVGTGHMVSLHYSAQTSFAKYHAFLAAKGF